MACFQGGKYHLQDGAKISFSGLISSVTLKGFAGVKYHKGFKKTPAPAASTTLSVQPSWNLLLWNIWL